MNFVFWQYSAKKLNPFIAFLFAVFQYLNWTKNAQQQYNFHEVFSQFADRKKAYPLIGEVEKRYEKEKFSKA